MTELPDIYFLPEWADLFREHDGGEPQQFRFSHEKGEVFYPFVKREIPNGLPGKKYYDTITGYGFSGPVILKGEAKDRDELAKAFDTAFQAHCEEQDIVSEYIRFSPWLRNHEDFKELYDLKYNNYTLFTDLTDRDYFNAQFSSKARNLIRKSIKSGVTIEFDHLGASVDEFYRIYHITAAKNEIAAYYLFSPELLQNTFSKLKGNAFIINARFEEKIISSAIFLQYGRYMHYHLAANDTAFYSLNANSLILSEACRWGVENGKAALHLGGAFTEQLFAFKKQFTKDAGLDFFIGKKIRNREAYDLLAEHKQKSGAVINQNYFPLYRG